MVFDWIAGLSQRGWVVRKQDDTNLTLKINQIINFSSVFKCFSLLLSCVFLDYSTSKQKAKQIQKTSLKSYKTQIKIFAYSGLA